MQRNDSVALAVRKHGRRCIVAKIVPLAGELVLAVVWRNQRGTRQAISLPTVVLDYARKAGVRRFVLRDDRRQAAYTAPLDIFDRGRLVGWERYIPLGWLQPTPWRDWPYTTEIVDLDLTPRPEVTLPLFGEVLP
jgi:hypothetical protein